MKLKVNWKELGKQVWSAVKPVLLAETNDTGARGGDMLKAGETMGGDGGAREKSAEEPNVEREAL